MTPTTTSSPIDPNYYHHHQYVKNNVFYNNNSMAQVDPVEFRKPGEIHDPEYGTFMNKRQKPYSSQENESEMGDDVPGSSPLAQRSMNKLNMMV
jgi:hypothetical protein